MGGHGVSEDTIDRRFVGSIENLKKIYRICDTINIYDNSGTSIELVAYGSNGKIEKTDIVCAWSDKLIEELNK